jgi:hypothetical protein
LAVEYSVVFGCPFEVQFLLLHSAWPPILVVVNNHFFVVNSGLVEVNSELVQKEG